MKTIVRTRTFIRIRSQSTESLTATESESQKMASLLYNNKLKGKKLFFFGRNNNFIYSHYVDRTPQATILAEVFQGFPSVLLGKCRDGNLIRALAHLPHFSVFYQDLGQRYLKFIIKFQKFLLSISLSLNHFILYSLPISFSFSPLANNYVFDCIRGNR